ncbi:MAG: cysteine--tRNA ligase [Pelagibacteraceae bacterium TMED237]|nr:cysteine--tRNA ligase [Candidatus Neomarinimicrobiota bacterium]OUW96750.1 MAG: cysteine--tRNA ligase [Pelagibacteraceae bacterium TMED237]|tara:strand:- start:174 stop:1565 length:1392 start_codon:yes stop_codon:yes gene_type:complete
MFELKIFNTLTNKKEEFIPINKEHVRMYACGPTVYNFAHIGNARPAVVCDVLVRLLRTLYTKVTYVSNITDIDDKIINVANESGVPIKDITRKFEDIYNKDMASLLVNKPDFQPRATDYISDMIQLVKKIIDQNCAYEENGHVFFDVSAYPAYGALSGRDLNDQIAGSRVEVSSLKRNPGDFVLWKPSNESQPGWDSPWGYGRPGWHLECSTMSEKNLGLPFDIHGGGLDLIFPHHENEIAQTCGAYAQKNNPQYFAKYWIHNGLLDFDGEKMSKSLGNILYVHDLVKQYPGEVLRLALLSTHYRQPLNWNSEIINQCHSVLDRLYRVLNKSIVEVKNCCPSKKVVRALCDDLNTSVALAEINNLSSQLSRVGDIEKEKEIKSKLIASSKLLGILQKNPAEWLGYKKIDKLDNKELIDELIDTRNKARKNRDFDKADQIREQLGKMNVEIEDTPDGTVWKIKK